MMWVSKVFDTHLYRIAIAMLPQSLQKSTTKQPVT